MKEVLSECNLKTLKSKMSRFGAQDSDTLTLKLESQQSSYKTITENGDKFSAQLKCLLEMGMEVSYLKDRCKCVPWYVS